MTRTLSRLALLGVLVAAAGCNPDRLVIANYNSPTVDGLLKDPNSVKLLANAMQIQMRGAYGGFINDVGIFGRESYNYFPTDLRNVTNYLQGIGAGAQQRLDPAGFANGNFGGFYTNMKNAVNIIAASEALKQSASDQAGVQGFAKTLRAWALLHVIMTRDTLGAPVDIVADVTAPADFVSRDSVYKYIIAMLDDAKTNLSAAGVAFPFALHAGFAGFNTPATFLKFNRAIQAKVNVIYGSLGCGATCYQRALTALGESFASPVGGAASLADLDRGPVHVYSTASGDAQNTISFSVQNYRFAHASIVTDAQLKANGQPDDRLTRKVVKLTTTNTVATSINLPADYRFVNPTTNQSSNPILRNEELMLLRAEANWATGNTGQALLDLNNIRQVSGGLAPVAALPAGSAGLDIIVYEKRYSTLWEGNRWVDMRRWGRLNQLPIDRTDLNPPQFRAKVMPIPQQECDARKGNLPKGCEGNL